VTAAHGGGRLLRLLGPLVIAYAIGAVAAAVLLRAATDAWWPVTVLAFGPRWVLALPLPLVVLAAVGVRRWRLLVPAFVAAAALFVAVDFRVPFGRTAAGPGGGLVVMTLNADSGRSSSERLRRVLAEKNVDIATVQECELDPAEWASGPWHLHSFMGLCLVTRFPLRDFQMRDREDLRAFRANGAAVRYVLDTPDGPLVVVSLHLSTVRDGLDELVDHHLAGRHGLEANTQMRDRESGLIRSWIDGAGSDRPAIVMGDMNMPVESAIYRRHWSSFTNAFSRCGLGLGWSKRTRFFGTRIDQILLADGFACATAEVAPDVGSDHRGVIARIARPAR
jgi:endonuclease/exonuclease/phosphatase family metal-dependent hydrolase